MIKANFNTYATYVTDSLYQWDINQKLQVTGLNLVSAPEVHFSNANMDRAIVRQSTMTNHVVTVNIPNSVLQDSLTIEADIGIYEGETFKVVEKVLIPVIPKKRPLDYTIEDSDEEIYSFNELKNALANKADNARVDNIIAHNNDTNGNTELVDIRLDIYGETHKSAGAAIRDQFSKTANANTVKCYVGIGEQKPLEIGYDYILLPKAVGIVILFDKERVVLDPDFIVAQLSDITQITDAGCKITIGNEYGLLYNVKTNSLRVRYRPIIDNNEILLFYNYYSNASGLLVENYSYRYIVDKAPILEAAAKSYELTRNGYIQLSTSGRLNIEHLNDGVKVTISTSLMIINNNSRNYLRADDIVSQLPKNAVKNEDDSVSITIADSKSLVLNAETMTLSIVNFTKIPQNSYLLITAYYWNEFGLFVDKYARDLMLDNYDMIVETNETANRLATETFNSPPIVSDYEWETKCREYAGLFNGKNNIESFMYFADPHLVQNTGWEKQCIEYINILNKIYNSTPTSYIVCGGDWLGNSDTQEYACFKLGYIDGFMKSMFDKYYHVVGNHDTNYQGKLTEDSENWTGTIDNNTIKNLWFRDTGSAFYRFEGVKTTNYVLDTQLDSNNATMNDYKWSQLHWLATDLIENGSLNIAIYMHIVFIDDEHNLSAMATHLGELIEAYNNRNNYSLNGSDYDFSKCTGHIDYVLSGHIHRDYSAMLGGVPCITTVDTRNGGTPSFDLCLADYDDRKLYMVRVGTGENRIFNF